MMRGLFIKDLKLMKGQKQFICTVLFMMVIFLGAYDDFSFVIAYIAVMSGMLTLTTISFDDVENGLGYLFTLPVTRKEYVGEKYLFGIITILPTLAMISICSFIAGRIRGIDFYMEECVVSVIASFMVVTLMLSVLIPLQLKFGAEKSRIAMTLAFGGGVLVVYTGIKICDTFGIDWKAAIELLSKTEPAASLAGSAVICVVILAVSYLFSLRVIEKREF